QRHRKSSSIRTPHYQFSPNLSIKLRNVGYTRLFYRFMRRFENDGKHICIYWYSMVLLPLFLGFVFSSSFPTNHPSLHRLFVHAWKDMIIDSQSDSPVERGYSHFIEMMKMKSEMLPE